MHAVPARQGLARVPPGVRVPASCAQSRRSGGLIYHGTIPTQPSYLARPSDAELLRQDAQGHGGTAFLRSGGRLCPSSRMCIVWAPHRRRPACLLGLPQAQTKSWVWLLEPNKPAVARASPLGTQRRKQGPCSLGQGLSKVAFTCH